MKVLMLAALTQPLTILHLEKRLKITKSQIMLQKLEKKAKPQLLLLRLQKRKQQSRLKPPLHLNLALLHSHRQAIKRSSRIRSLPSNR